MLLVLVSVCARIVIHQTRIPYEPRQLVRASSSAHWTETKDMLHKMTKLTVETGTATALGATVELVFFWAFHHNNVHFVL